MWVKNSMPDAVGQNPLWSASPATDNNNYYGLYLGSDQLRYHNANASTTDINGSNKLRDSNSWYHIHTKVDNNTAQCYINGEAWGGTFTLNGGWWNNTSYRMDIGSHAINNGVTGAAYAGYQFADVYHIDGQALGPEYFGNTDALTGVWTPKKADIQANSAAYSYNIYSTSDNGSGAPSDLNTTSKTNITFATNGFDGNSATFCVNSDSSMTGWTVFRPASPIPVSSSLVIRCTRTGQIWLNGADSGVDNDQNSAQDITVPLGGATEITSIELQNSATVSLANRFAQIIVDGTVLTDQVTWGTNGFYLPMDGKTPVNEDQSPNGHIFYTNYFSTTAGVASGSLSNHVTLDKATGAIPILKTDPSGQVMTGGPRTDRRSFKVTVVSTAEGNKYFLNGERVSPGSLALYRGGLYTFDQSDSSNATHPLRFATAADAAGSTEYTDGVTQGGTPGSTGAYTEIIVPHNAPDTLYYYCTNHGGMGGPTANTTDIHVADPYAWKLQLAIPFNSKNTSSTDRGCENWANGFTNTLTNGGGGKRTMAVGPDLYLTPTNTRNTATEYAFYGGSRNFNNSQTDYITINGTGNGAAFAFGTGDFTLECWAKFDSLGEDSSSAILTTASSSQEVGSWIWGFTGANAPTNCFGFCHEVHSSFSWEAGKIDGYFHSWHHYAVCRKNGVIKMFIDGVLWRAFSNTYDYSHQGNPQIGQRWTNTNDYSLDGELQDLRVYKGVAKYFDNTSTTVGEVEFLCGTSKPYFTPEVPKGTPYPGTLKKIEGGAVHFPRGNSADILSIPDSADFDLGSGDFTIECFFYVDKDSQTLGMLAAKADNAFNASTSSFFFRVQPQNAVQFYMYYGSSIATLQSTQHNIQEYSWNHAAVTRKSGVVYLYLNGHLEAYADLSSNAMNTSSAEIRIGGAGASSSYPNPFKGYISNLRIVKGTAIYTSEFPAFSGPTASFAPPTGPLENVPGTVLLCCQSTTSAADATVSPGAITVNGRAGSTNFSPFINNLLQLQGPENNYATLEPTKIKTHNTEAVDGGLSIAGNSGSAWNTFPGTMGASSGKWYWEVYDKTGLFDMFVGAAQDGSFHMWDTDVYPGQSSYGNSFGLKESGNLYVNGTQSGSWSSAFGPNDGTRPTIGCALDMDAGKAYISINGVWGPDATPSTNGMVSDGTATAAATGLTGTYRPVIGVNGGTYNWDTLEVNFGQRPFRYAPPEGYKCWNRTNMPAPEKAARNANKNFQALIWTGDGVSPKTRTGLNFKPDFVWIKERNQAFSIGHRLYDSVRGAGVDKHLDSSTDKSEGFGNDADYGYVTGFVEGGFTTIAGSSGDDYVNDTSTNYVAWCWKAGETFTPSQTGGITNLAGSRNTDAGFSIVKYTGSNSAATFGHGLNSAPEMIIIKNRDGNYNWFVYHKDINPAGAAEDWYVMLDVEDARTLAGDAWGSTPPDSSVVHVGAVTETNGSGNNLVAYCFHSVEGYCKVGNYIGNGNASGPVVYTGFKPAFVLIKRTDSNFGGEWSIFDNVRNTTNPCNLLLAPDTNAAERTDLVTDFLSNGFKIRVAGDWQNQGGGNYIYLAFAEVPTNAGFGAVVNAR